MIELKFGEPFKYNGKIYHPSVIKEIIFMDGDQLDIMAFEEKLWEFKKKQQQNARLQEYKRQQYIEKGSELLKKASDEMNDDEIGGDKE